MNYLETFYDYKRLQHMCIKIKLYSNKLNALNSLLWVDICDKVLCSFLKVHQTSTVTDQ